MQARVGQQGDVVVVHLSGRVDVETAEPFRRACLDQLSGKKVIFDFRSLSFVGSSGILPFLKTMQEFAERNPNSFKFSGVGSEFKKVFAATPLHLIEIHESPLLAAEAFRSPISAPVAAAIASSQCLSGTGSVMSSPLIKSDIESDQEDDSSADFGMLSLALDPLADLSDAMVDDEV